MVIFISKCGWVEVILICNFNDFIFDVVKFVILCEDFVVNEISLGVDGDVVFGIWVIGNGKEVGMVVVYVEEVDGRGISNDVIVVFWVFVYCVDVYVIVKGIVDIV